MACVALAVLATWALFAVVGSLATTQPLPALVAAINQSDRAAVGELLVEGDPAWQAHSEWLIATNATLALNGCTTGTAGLVTCQVRFGDGWFFNQAAPAEVARLGSLVTSLTVEITDHRVRVAQWPLPAGLPAVEDSFRRWVLQVHPEMSELLWRSPTVGSEVEQYMIIDAAAGEAHMRLCEEYLQYLNPPAV